jgi:hypothetical protein
MSDLQQRQFKFSKMIGELLVWLYSQDYTCQFGDVWRSTDKLKVPTGQPGFDDDEEYSYQELLFYNKKSKLTQGKHNDRLAADLIIYKDSTPISETDYRIIGEKWEEMGGRWGGRFGVKKEEYATKIGWDADHFELS